jgi:hypothetical protein
MSTANTLRYAQVHRYDVQVAAFICGIEDTSATVYLTPEQADKLGDALKAAARDVLTCGFATSPLKTFELRGEGPRHG